MVDFDDFKHINDTYGHLKGDKILEAFSSISFKKIRKSDILGRYGGEEFIIVLIGAKLNGAISVAERLRQKVEIHNFEKIPLPVTISIGVVEYKKNEKIDTLINRADKKLYNAKKTGRNTVKY